MRTALLAMAVASLACAPNYYDTYTAENPGWYGDVPRPGASLHEVLAGLYAPPVADYSRFVSKLAVLRLDGDTTSLLADDEIASALTASGAGNYAVVATVTCQSEYNLNRYRGEKVAWYLLPAGQLSAYDHFDFVDLCTVSNDFRPARGDEVALENEVVAYRDENFPTSMQHVGEFYARGLAYLAADRPDDALRMLRAGDAAHDVGSRGERHQDFENASRIRTAGASDIERMRRALVEKLGASDAPEP